MQIVTSGENLHEISTRFLGKVKKKKKMICRPLKNIHIEC